MSYLLYYWFLLSLYNITKFITNMHFFNIHSHIRAYFATPIVELHDIKKKIHDTLEPHALQGHELYWGHEFAGICVWLYTHIAYFNPDAHLGPHEARNHLFAALRQ